MEETKPRPGFPGDRAQVAAEKLRALRERANQALDEHRQRLGQIESELSLRVRQLAEEFETASAGIERHSKEGRDDEVASLREQLEAGRAKHDKFVEQLGAARRQLDAIQAQPCAACQDAAHQLADAQAEMSRLREQVQSSERKHEEDRTRHEKFTEQVAAARQAISDLQSKSHEQTGQLQSELDAALAAKTAAEQQVAVLARDMEALHGEYDALQAQAEQLEKQRTASLDEQRRAADAELAAQAEQLSALRNELATIQQAHDGAEKSAESLRSQLAGAQTEREALTRRQGETERDKLAAEAELAALKSTVQHDKQARDELLAAAEAKQSELQERLKSAESESSTLTAALAAAAAERSAVESSLDAARRQASALEEAGGEVAALKSANERAASEASVQAAAAKELHATIERLQRELADLREASSPRAELDDLQHKFDLALADLQKLKRENGELREELAVRPKASDQESPELVSIRTERDALAQRVEELERAAVTAVDATPSQETEDLHRRFEMAVDDVRQLKQENTQLRDQLAKVKSAGPAAASPQGGSNDWASQRARLVAMLEQEEGDGAIDAARRKERASIEDAIHRTDSALAEKDRELAELRAAHESYAVTSASDRRDSEREEILSADKLIAAERDRLAALQTEWEQKLRSAELEFSVERAKLAREQAALKERLFDLQKLESQAGPTESGDAKPGRRWRLALGLGDEGEGVNNPK
jgi:chromosome segregation ATPase